MELYKHKRIPIQSPLCLIVTITGWGVHLNYTLPAENLGLGLRASKPSKNSPFQRCKMMANLCGFFNGGHLASLSRRRDHRESFPFKGIQTKQGTILGTGILSNYRMPSRLNVPHLKPEAGQRHCCRGGLLGKS